jgi:hypothetical protein
VSPGISTLAHEHSLVAGRPGLIRREMRDWPLWAGVGGVSARGTTPRRSGRVLDGWFSRLTLVVRRPRFVDSCIICLRSDGFPVCWSRRKMAHSEDSAAGGPHSGSLLLARLTSGPLTHGETRPKQMRTYVRMSLALDTETTGRSTRPFRADVLTTGNDPILRDAFCPRR